MSFSSARTERPSLSGALRELETVARRSGKQRTAVSGGEAPVDEHRLDRIGQREQSQRIGDRRAALAEAPRQIFLREAVLIDQARKAGGFFDRIEVLALQVLDDRDFERIAVVGFAHDRRNRRLAAAPRTRASAVRPRRVRSSRRVCAR